jgi:hypothetical protein
MPTLNWPRHSSPNLIGQPSEQAGLSPIVLANSYIVIASKLTTLDAVDVDDDDDALFILVESFFSIVEFICSLYLLCWHSFVARNETRRRHFLGRAACC